MDWNKFKTDWIAELRSGNRPQAKGTLCQWDDDVDPSTDVDPDKPPGILGFCCLGVAAEVIEPGSTKVNWTGFDHMSGWCAEGGGDLRHEDVLIDDFIEAHSLWKLKNPASDELKAEATKRGIALTRSDGGDYHSVADVLMNLNDSSQCDFNVMADIIERHL